MYPVLLSIVAAIVALAASAVVAVLICSVGDRLFPCVGRGVRNAGESISHIDHRLGSHAASHPRPRGAQ